MVIEDLFNSLNAEQKEKLLKLCLDYESLKIDFTERSQNNTLCPYCHKNHIVKMGKNGSVQKFKCKDCGKIFSIKTNTIFANSNKSINVWKKYIELMFDGLSLDTISQRMKINIKTAFYWRHKILKFINTIPTEKLNGIIEVDETYFKESQKGSRKMTRPSRKRGQDKFSKYNKLVGTSREKVCVLCAIDRNNLAYNKPVCFGKPNDSILYKNLKNVLAKQSKIITDKLIAYKNAFENEGYTLEQVKGGYEFNNQYNLNHINSYHSGLKEWVRRFKGVSTKYLDNYVNFFKIVKSKKNVFEEIIKISTSCLISDIQNKVIDF